MRKGWVTTDQIGDTRVSVPVKAITAGPHVQWNHVDGPLMTWAGNMHWLTWSERLGLFLGRTTVDAIASHRWPHLVKLRAIHS